MAFIPPIVTPVPPVLSIVLPSVSTSNPLLIQGNGVTYAQFLQSLGKYNYGAEFFYLSSTSYQQIGQVFSYNHFDANGDSISAALPFTVDPYQSQPAVFYETEPDQIILTGLSSLTFTVLPKTNIYFKFFATITYLGNELDDRGLPSGDNAFEELEKAEGISFFDDYCNYLIDND